MASHADNEYVLYIIVESYASLDIEFWYAPMSKITDEIVSWLDVEYVAHVEEWDMSSARAGFFQFRVHDDSDVQHDSFGCSGEYKRGRAIADSIFTKHSKPMTHAVVRRTVTAHFC